MPRYVAIEGVIGVGKTTLTRLLATHRHAFAIYEPAADNPFLEPFYADPVRWAFPTQLHFLVNRWRQQQELHNWMGRPVGVDLAEFDRALAVSDYLPQKDRLFAQKILSAEELRTYDEVASRLEAAAPSPDLVVWLRAPIEVCLQRIAARRAAGEGSIDARYLDDLARRYEGLFANWTACPVLEVDNRDMDVRVDGAAREALFARIDAALSGR